MIWILTTILIPLRRKNSSHRFQQRICPCAVRRQRVVLFYHPSIHQISTLEKTKFYQHSVLSSLMSVCIQRVSPLYRISRFAGSEDIVFRVWFLPGFLMQWKIARQEPFRCIARPNSSSALVLLSLFLHLHLLVFFFDITSGQLVELKWLMLNKHKRCFHPSRVKFPLVSMSASRFSVSMYLIWIFGSKLILSNNQEQLCRFWKHVSLSDSFLWWSSSSLLRCPQTLTTKLLDAKTGRLREHNQHYSARWYSLEIFEFCQW